MRRELNWVAWKNNYASLGLNDEQGECYRQERLQVCGPAPKWVDNLLAPSRPPWLQHAIDLALRAASSSIVSIIVVLGLVGTLAALGKSAQPLTFAEVPCLVAGPGLVFGFGVTVVTIWLLRLKGMRARFWDGLFGFGEKPIMIVINAVIVIAVFAVAYGVLDTQSDHLHLGNVRMNNDAPAIWTEYLYFSTVTFTTLGHFNYKAFLIFPALISLEGAIGLIFAALLIQTLARRIGGR